VPSALAKPRRLVLPPLTDEQQVRFAFDYDYPNDQRQPEAEAAGADKILNSTRQSAGSGGLGGHALANSQLSLVAQPHSIVLYLLLRAASTDWHAAHLALKRFNAS
jgi:hypothetical protein